MKYFVISDIHGYYDLMIDALNKAGFDKDNKEHWLVSLGDLFDRGDQPQEILNYILSLERKILVKGNHEDLMDELIARGYPKSHDIRNGTLNTMLQLGEIEGGWYHPTKEDFYNAANVTSAKLVPYNEQLVNYFETKNYIFVHSWIPVNFEANEKYKDLGIYGFANPKFVYDPNWRTTIWKDSWTEEAMWCNPFSMAHKGLNQTGKTIVSGHWHTSYPRAVYNAIDENESEWGPDANFDIYYDEEHKHIGIDGCVAYSGQINVLVVEDDLLCQEDLNEQV